MATKVFISYSDKDRADAVRLQQALEQEGIEAWSALDLAAGARWAESIESHLRSAQAVVVLVSPRSLESNWVQHEWSVALAQSKRVIPALVGGATYADLKGPLARIQAVDLNTNFEEGLARIGGALAGLASSAEPPPSEYINIEAIVGDAVERKLASIGVDLSPQQATTEVDPHCIFVISSFAPDMEPIYEAISSAASAVGLRATRVKDIAGDYQITEKILSNIRSARFVVADLTHERPNVYFELGYARGLDKTVITIARVDTEIHFDVRGWTYLEYFDSRPLEVALVERFQYELDNGREPA